MRIDELFGAGRPLVSFEFFPPKNEEGSAQLLHTIEELRPLNPDYVSITRTGGGTPPTLDLTSRIQNDLGIRSMAHMTCAGYTVEEIDGFLDRLWESGIHNVLALRGDPQPGETAFSACEGGLAYASEMVAAVKARHDFCIGVAGYPETHPESTSPEADLDNLKRKVDNGAHFVITQLFFDNADFYRWRDAAHALGVTVPLVAGIMPILSVSQIKRFVTMCGAKIPQPLLSQLESLEADPLSVHAAGVEHAIKQCEDLRANGVEGLHFYTLNRSKATVLICQALGLHGHVA
jgi:methylenetetrahydrofolate reductase (NADPH)